MILPTMTYKELYNHLAADKQKVDIRKEYFMPKAVRAFKKKTKFPAWEIYEYTVPATNNKYVIYFYAENRLRAEKPEVGSFCIAYNGQYRFVVQWSAGPYKHTPNSEMIVVKQIHAYTSHFMQRYNERFLKDETLTPNEVAARYLSRNPVAMPLQQNDGINRNHEKYGEKGRYAFRVRDGICFSYSSVNGIPNKDGDRHKDQVEALYICYTTFMNESAMTQSQRKAIFDEHCKQWVQAYTDFQREAQDEVMSLSEIGIGKNNNILSSV